MTSFQNSSFQNKGYLIINKSPQYFIIHISYLIFFFLRTKLQTINRFIHLYIYLILSCLEHFTSRILYFVLSVKVTIFPSNLSPLSLSPVEDTSFDLNFWQQTTTRWPHSPLEVYDHPLNLWLVLPRTLPCSRLRTVRVVRAGSVGLQIRQRGLRRRQIGHLRRNAKQVIKVWWLWKIIGITPKYRDLAPLILLMNSLYC